MSQLFHSESLLRKAQQAVEHEQEVLKYLPLAEEYFPQALEPLKESIRAKVAELEMGAEQGSEYARELAEFWKTVLEKLEKSPELLKSWTARSIAGLVLGLKDLTARLGGYSNSEIRAALMELLARAPVYIFPEVTDLAFAVPEGIYISAPGTLLYMAGKGRAVAKPEKLGRELMEVFGTVGYLANVETAQVPAHSPELWPINVLARFGALTLVPVFIHEALHYGLKHPERTAYLLEVFKNMYPPEFPLDMYLPQIANIAYDSAVNRTVLELQSLPIKRYHNLTDEEFKRVINALEYLLDKYVGAVSYYTLARLLLTYRKAAEKLRPYPENSLSPNEIMKVLQEAEREAAREIESASKFEIVRKGESSVPWPVALQEHPVLQYLRLENPEAIIKDIIDLIYEIWKKMKKEGGKGEENVSSLGQAGKGREWRDLARQASGGGGGQSGSEKGAGGEGSGSGGSAKAGSILLPPSIRERPPVWDVKLRPPYRGFKINEPVVEKPREVEETITLRPEVIEPLKRAGVGAAGLKREVEYLYKASIDWRRLIRDLLNRYFKSIMTRRTWTWPSFVAPGKAPGRTRAGLPPFIALIDTSGSITDWEIEQFISELHALMQRYRPDIYLIWWDTAAYGPYLAKTPKMLLEIAKETARGGGGTVIYSALEKAINLVRSLGGWGIPVIIFTDAAIADLTAPETLRLLEELAKQAPLKIFATTWHSPPEEVEKMGWTTVFVRPRPQEVRRRI